MAKSRFTNTLIMKDPTSAEPAHYATWDLPVTMKGYNPIDLLADLQTYSHIWVRGDRMDKLASQYLGDDDYGWLICLVNGINDPLSVQPGTVIKIPPTAQSVLEKLGM